MIAGNSSTMTLNSSTTQYCVFKLTLAEGQSHMSLSWDFNQSHSKDFKSVIFLCKVLYYSL